MADERELLIEQAAGAYRERNGFGELRDHPAWHDLDASGRRESFELALELRRLESALDPEGLSTTAHQILARIRG